jgi:hypothetical protein
MKAALIAVIACGVLAIRYADLDVFWWISRGR